MATPTTLNIGEPADERSVDGNNAPTSAFSQGGDQEPFNEEMKDISPGSYDEFMSKTHRDIDSEYDDEEEKKKLLQIFPEVLITKSDVVYKIAPAVGAVCYGYFSISVLEPRWFSRAFGDAQSSVRNTLWFASHLGAGLYIYSHRHIRNLPLSRGLLYSAFGSLLFNFGSCMFWGLGKAAFQSTSTFRVAFGLISSCFILYAGQDYLQYVDSKYSELD